MDGLRGIMLAARAAGIAPIWSSRCEAADRTPCLSPARRKQSSPVVTLDCFVDLPEGTGETAALHWSLSRDRQSPRPALPELQYRARLLSRRSELADGGGSLSQKLVFV